jgi:hypothetical protein
MLSSQECMLKGKLRKRKFIKPMNFETVPCFLGMKVVFDISARLRRFFVLGFSTCLGNL